MKITTNTSDERPTLAESIASLNSAQLHADLHAISKQNKSENEIRAEFREIAFRYSSAVGVAHVIKNASGTWDLDPEHSTGRVPRRNDFCGTFRRELRGGVHPEFRSNGIVSRVAIRICPGPGLRLSSGSPDDSRG